MTGYGQASADLNQVRVTVELRSVNHRFADLRLRMPAELAAEESAIRRRIRERVRRGRIELSVRVEPLDGPSNRPVLNRALLDAVLAAAGELRSDSRIQGSADLALLLGVPGMFRPASEELIWDDTGRLVFQQALDAALEALDQERRREGRHLLDDLLQRVSTMNDRLEEMRVRAAATPRTVHERLCDRLKTLTPELQLDPDRIAQEAALLADRSDVTEELVRLEGHLEQGRRLLAQPDGEPVGKRLEFLLQEINREANTVGSKSVDLELTRRALDLKNEIEKVREQIQNLE